MVTLANLPPWYYPAVKNTSEVRVLVANTSSVGQKPLQKHYKASY